MKILSLLSIILLCSTLSIAQNQSDSKQRDYSPLDKLADAPPPPPRKIRYIIAKPGECSPVNFEASPGQIECDHMIVDGRSVRTVLDGGLSIAATFYWEGGYAIADMYVKNSTGRRILVDPDIWSLRQTKTEAELYDDKPNWERPVPADVIVSKYLKRIAWANALSGLGSSMATTQARVTTSTGQSATVTAPDTARQARTANENIARSRSANTEAGDILSTALKANTVLDSNSVDGLVYFKRNKKAKFGVFQIKIDYTVYMFPYWVS